MLRIKGTQFESQTTGPQATKIETNKQTLVAAVLGMSIYVLPRDRDRGGPSFGRSNFRQSYFCTKILHRFRKISVVTLQKTNMDAQNHGLEKVTPFENGKFWYLCQISVVTVVF